MLALTNSQLGMLAIAASAVPPSQRGRWLRKIADELDGDRAKRHVARMARTRQRQRDGKAIFRIEAERDLLP